jgi:GDPmannose 4,6-dehydratase
MRVLITGISGQDGWYLRNFLQNRGIEIFGLVSKGQNQIQFQSGSDSSQISPKYLKPFNLNDISDSIFADTLDMIQPDRIFHLAAIHQSSNLSKRFYNSNKLRIHLVNVEMARQFLIWVEKNPDSRLFLALTSQMYSADSNQITSITENHIQAPTNYYAETKSIAWDLAKKSRLRHGTKVSAGILFNHTSPRSKSDFLFPTLAKKIMDVIDDRSSDIVLEDFNALIDMTHAEEVVQCIWNISDKFPDSDFVIGSGKILSIKTIADQAFEELGYNLAPKYISTNKNPNSSYLVSNISKISEATGWKPIKNSSEILVELIIAINSGRDC